MRFVDLSTSLVNDAVSEIRPSKVRYITHNMEESWKHFTDRFECDRSELPNGWGNAVEEVFAGTHTSTHMDAPFHFGPEMQDGTPTKHIDEIPLDWCYHDGVVLDFRSFSDGQIITPEDIDAELKRINYEIKPWDIVLIMTGRDKFIKDREKYFAQPGMGRDAVLYLVDKGVKIIGIDAWGFDANFSILKKIYKETGDSSVIWQAHRAGLIKEYTHIEKLMNLDQLPPYGFKVICFPVKIEHGSAGWTRVVAMLED